MFRRQIVVAAALAVCTLGNAAVYVLDDFDSLRQVKFSTNAGGGSSTIGNFDADADNELQKVTSTSADFLQYFRSDGLARTGATMDALLAGNAIEMSIAALDSNLSQNINVGLVVNTNAWATNPTNTYRRVKTVAVNDGADRNVAMKYDYTPTSGFYLALQNWKNGGGTFFEFYVDNTGYPAISTPQTFRVDDITVTGVPEPTAALALAATGALMLSRRRRVR